VSGIPRSVIERLIARRLASRQSLGATHRIDTMSPELIAKLLKDFLVVFPMPTDAPFHRLCSTWHAAIGDLEPAAVYVARDRLIQQLTRFPYPADLRAAVRSEAQEDPASPV
jgi:hypothetical protein